MQQSFRMSSLLPKDLYARSQICKTGCPIADANNCNVAPEQRQVPQMGQQVTRQCCLEASRTYVNNIWSRDMTPNSRAMNP